MLAGLLLLNDTHREKQEFIGIQEFVTTESWLLLIGLFDMFTQAVNRSSYWRFSIKKMFLKISQTSQENTCARASFLIKLQA